MRFPTPVAIGWAHAVLLASIPWLALWEPWLAPAVVALAALLHAPWRRHAAADPWAAGAGAVLALGAVAAVGATTEAAAWLLLAALVAGVARLTRGTATLRPNPADLVALVGWGGAFVLLPQLLAPERGGWVGPAIALLLARRLGHGGRDRMGTDVLVPPSHEAAGALALRGLVVADEQGLPRGAPLELDVAVAESVAVVCETRADAEAVAFTVAGRRAPAAGTVLVDGEAMDGSDQVVAVVAPGEPFLTGDVDDNLAALSDDLVARDTALGVREACALDEVERALDGREVSADGEPLVPLHRLLLGAARVIPSAYRIVVVVDPMPWVNAMRGSLWRAAVVRASVGRTALWLTPDRELAACADRVFELRHGVLRPQAAAAQSGEERHG